MKVALYGGPKHITIQERPKPKAGPGQAIIKVKYCGICGTDLHSYLHEGVIAPGTVFGHETVGVIEELGEGVRGLKINDRVVVGPPGNCGACYNCLKGHANICSTGFENTTGISPNTDGGYSEYMRVLFAERMCLPIPENVSFEDAVLFDIITTSYHGIRRSVFKTGDNVVIIGAGPIGLSAVMLLKLAGAAHITVLEFAPEKRELALSMGADLVLDPAAESEGLVEKVLPFSDGVGVDVVFECTGNSKAYFAALDLVKTGGEILIIGLSPEPIPLNTAQFVQREINFTTSFVYDPAEVKIILKLMAAGRLNTDGMVTDIIGLEDVVEKGFEKLLTDSSQIKILLAP